MCHQPFAGPLWLPRQDTSCRLALLQATRKPQQKFMSINVIARVLRSYYSFYFKSCIQPASYLIFLIIKAFIQPRFGKLQNQLCRYWIVFQQPNLNKNNFLSYQLLSSMISMCSILQMFDKDVLLSHNVGILPCTVSYPQKQFSLFYKLQENLAEKNNTF